MTAVTPHDLLNAYASGYFPMADSADADEIYWYDPPQRGQLSIPHMHVPQRLRKTLRRAPYSVKFNTDFAGVIDGCAAATATRPSTWINRPIRDLFIALHERGFAHSAECWHDGKLVGGVYGLALGSAFFGESMFSTATDASKIALCHLMARLWHGGFTLFDTQFTNPHLTQFGVYEVPRDQYKAQLQAALAQAARIPVNADPAGILALWLAQNPTHAQ